MRVLTPFAIQPTLVFLSIIFLCIGALSAMNDVFIPFFKIILHLNYVKAMSLQFSFFIAYAVGSIPLAYCATQLGYLNSLRIGLGLCTFGFLFGIVMLCLPYQFLFYGFITAIFIIALGLVMLLVVAEPYVVLFGKRASASSRLVFLQGIHSTGATITPWLIGSLLFAPDVTLTLQTAVGLFNVVMWTFAIILLVITFLFYFSPLREPDVPLDTKPHNLSKTFALPKVIFGWLALFLYVGAEVTIPALLVNFIMQVSHGHISHLNASHHISFYWAGILVGRLIGSFILRRIQAEKLMVLCVVSAIILLIVAMVSPNAMVAIWAMVAIGLCNSVIFPTIYSLTVQDLGDQALKGSGVLATAVSGGAIISIIQGYSADHLGLLNSFFIPMLCYIGVLAYTLWVKLSVSSRPPSRDLKA